MLASQFEDTLQLVISTVRSIKKGDAVVMAQTRLLSDLDMDSLETLELADRLRQLTGIDLTGAGYSLSDFATPETIARALTRAGSNEPSAGCGS
jgi:acyl carrier protein